MTWGPLRLTHCLRLLAFPGDVWRAPGKTLIHRCHALSPRHTRTVSAGQAICQGRTWTYHTSPHLSTSLLPSSGCEMFTWNTEWDRSSKTETPLTIVKCDLVSSVSIYFCAEPPQHLSSVIRMNDATMALCNQNLWRNCKIVFQFHRVFRNEHTHL